MAHFALMSDDGTTVVQVNPVCNCAIGGCIGPDSPFYKMNPDQHANCGTLDFPETEPMGQAMLAESGFEGYWLQCSYSGSFRSAFPGYGWTYDADLDAFAPPVEQP